MKEFEDLQLTASQLSLLLSREISKDLLGAGRFDKNPSISVRKAKEDHIIKHVECFDARYDKLDEFDFAVSEINKKGLNRDLEEKILTNKSCISKADLVGSFSFLKNFLSAEYIDKIKQALSSKREFHTSTDWAHFSSRTQIITPQQLMKL